MERDRNSLLHNFAQSGKGPLFTGTVFIILCIMALLGIGTGYLLSQNGGKVGSVNLSSVTSGVSSGTVEGSDDTKTFKDIAEGKLQDGGIEGEGQYHLDRPGGETQTVYMTSSIVDLSKYVGKNVKVWGQSQKAQKAPWLMDVGRIQVQ